MTRRRMVILALGLSILLAPLETRAANYVVYLHGRSQNFWPGNALVGHSSAWIDWVPEYDGSGRLTSVTDRARISETIESACRNGNSCVIMCYSAGCYRMLLALEDLRAAGRPATGLLWAEAAASAAGGSELASFTTKKGIRLLIKVAGYFAPIDDDLAVGTARGTFGFIQNAAPAPIYHLAGDLDICLRLKGVQAIAAGTLVTVAGHLIGGPVGFFTGLGALLGSGKLKLCMNSFFPDHSGDGVVPVHSAAGYSDAGGHLSHNDGGGKFVFRAYEQVPLYPFNHQGALGALVPAASLRLAVNKSVTCRNHPNGPTADPGAQIVFDDADGSRAIESTPMYLLQLCSDEALVDAVEVSSCVGDGGCCSNFSTGQTGGCSCGEVLCIQSRFEGVSYYTGENCEGTEYSDGTNGANYHTWDGHGMIGQSTVPVTVRSGRSGTGTCRALTHATSWNAPGCVNYRRTSLTIAGRRVYRPNIDGHLVDPNGTNTEPGLVVSSNHQNRPCP